MNVSRQTLTQLGPTTCAGIVVGEALQHFQHPLDALQVVLELHQRLQQQHQPVGSSGGHTNGQKCRGHPKYHPNFRILIKFV